MQNLLGQIPSGHFILQYLEKRVKSQLKALHLEEEKAARLIQEHLQAIDQWDEANAQLLSEIRDAEAIIKKKGWDWSIVPDRDPRSKTAGSTYFIHGPWSPRPLEEPEPSAWCLVRYWRGEEDPRVWAAKARVTHQNGILSDKRANLDRLQDENENLWAKKEDTIRKRDAVQWGPCQPKPTSDTWAAKEYSLLNRPVIRSQPAPAQIQTNPFCCDLDFTNERIHCEFNHLFFQSMAAYFVKRLLTITVCEFCGKDGHRWECQYEFQVMAKAAPFARPCPAHLARPKPRPFFVSAAPPGGQSFWDPDVVVAVAPQRAQVWPAPAPAPAPLTLAQNFLPPAPLFPAPPAPLFSAPSAPLVTAKATAPLFSAYQAQSSAPNDSIPIAAPPPAPQATHITTSFTPSAAAAITRSTTPPCTPPPRPAALATAAAPVVKRAPAAPTKGRGLPSALQIVWPGQTTAGPAASAANHAAQEKAQNEQAVAALVQQEAEARAAEKAMAKRQKKQTSAPQAEKKNYRF